MITKFYEKISSLRNKSSENYKFCEKNKLFKKINFCEYDKSSKKL